MILSKDFKIRICESTQEVGIKEEFKTFRDGDMDIVNAVFGLDREVNLTRPAIYSKTGFKPLTSVNADSIDFKEFVDTFTRSKKGVYSVQGATMLICYFSGKLKDGVWQDETVCDLYLPYCLNKDSITAVKVTESPVYGCIAFPKLDSIKEIVMKYLTEVCPSKTEFIVNRYN